MSLDLFNKIESVGRNAETYYEAEIKKDFPNYSMIIERFKKVITMRPSTLKEKKWIADSYFRLAICEVNKKEDGYIAYEALSYYQAAEQRYLSITTEIENLRKSQRSMDSPQLSALYYNLGICQCRIGILYIDIDNTANSTRMISMSTCNHEGYFKNAKEHFKAALKESNRELESQLALDARRSFEFKLSLRRKYGEFDINCMNGLGVACFYLKEGEEAKYYFNKCVSMQQKEQNINYNPLYNLGNLLYEQKRYHESLDIFYRCLKNNQSQTKYMRRLADTLLSLKRYEEAKEYYKNALKIFPNPYYRNGLAICLLNENNNEQSETEVDNVMDNYGIRIPLPDNLLDEIGKLTMEGKNSIVESLTIKAFILLRTNRRKAAIIYIDTAIKIIDKYNLEIVVPLFFKAIFFINNKDYDDGLDLFVEIIKRKDNFAEAYHGAGICCCNLGDDKKGVEFFQSALQLKPELTPAYLHKQQVYSQKSNSNVFDFISYWTKTRMRGFIFILLVTFAFFTVILSVLNPSIQITDVENRTAIDNHVITTKTDYNNTFVFLSLIIGTILLIIWPSVKNFKVGTSTFELEKIEYPEKLNDLSLDWVDIDLILRNSITI